MHIEDCYKCGEPVRQYTNWDVDVHKGFLCENCNVKNRLSDEEYHANAAWLKSLKNEGSK